MELYGGIDIGLSGVRATLVSAQAKLVAGHRITADTDALSAEAIVALGCKAFRQMGRPHDKHKILGLGLACFGPSPVLVGKSGEELLRVPLLLQAGHGDGPQDDLLARLQTARAAYRTKFASASSYVDLNGFAVRKISDAEVMDSITASDFRPAKSILPIGPVIKPADSLAGPLTSAAARRLGISRGTPVTVGCYDSTADIAAAGFGKKRPAVMVLGSTLVIGRWANKPVTGEELRSTTHIGEGYFCGGWTNMAGSSLNLTRSWVQTMKAQSIGPVPLVLPYFAGERSPVWNLAASGAMLGLTSRMNAADLQRGVLEGVTLGALDIAERLERQLGHAKRWTVIGGGTNNRELMQALADALGAKLDVVRDAGEALGPAVLAARANGQPITLPVAHSWYPRKARTDHFVRRLELYRRCHAALTPLYADLRNHQQVKGKAK